MNIYIEYGLYAAAFMMIATFIISMIRNKDSPNLNLIPNTIFGFIMGSVGRLLYDEIMREAYPLAPTFTIICLCLLGIGFLGTSISILVRRTSQ